jgi:hypothetical protein
MVPSVSSNQTPTLYCTWYFLILCFSTVTTTVTEAVSVCQLHIIAVVFLSVLYTTITTMVATARV